MLNVKKEVIDCWINGDMPLTFQLYIVSRESSCCCSDLFEIRRRLSGGGDISRSIAYVDLTFASLQYARRHPCHTTMRSPYPDRQTAVYRRVDRSTRIHPRQISVSQLKMAGRVNAMQR